MRDSKPTISALIIARDEAANIEGCLASLAWADERIVVVDAASSDGTEAAARKFATRVIVREFDDFSAQRNAGLALARGDWVFSIDADERVTPELARELPRAIGDARCPHAGYRVPITSEILGRRFRFSGTQDDRPVRLFRRDRGRWIGAVHETVALNGSCGMLENSLMHRSLHDMSTFLVKIDRYTSLQAREDFAGGRRPRSRELLLEPAWVFVKLYFGKKGFRDGVEGFVFCALSAVSNAVRHWKLRELARPGQLSDSVASARGGAPQVIRSVA